MIVRLGDSTWGVKDSGQDITQDILAIASNATSFIIVGGYNFTFKTAGYTFFNILKNQVAAGIPVLMIIPSNLPGFWSNQAQIINFCHSHGIGLILNGNNHSKWLLTESDLYYGSSNFTETSWKHKVEVVTIHNRVIGKKWKRDTVYDFYSFVLSEIARINTRKKMLTVPGLIAHTKSTWGNICPLVRKLNPSVRKVIFTLQHYHEVESMLEDVIEQWFEFYSAESFEKIYRMNSEILSKVNQLCEFAYHNIYNEFSEYAEVLDAQILDAEAADSEVIDSEVVKQYNQFHMEFLETVNKNISYLSANETEFTSQNFRSSFDYDRILERVGMTIRQISE